MANLPIKERLRHYFIAMGAENTEPIEGHTEGLTLTLGSERVHITILTNEIFLQRGKMVESVISLASLKDSADRLYLAAPRLLGTTVEAGIFRSHGIGLLLFDDRRIEEIVSPQSFQQHQPAIGNHTRDQLLMTEIETLKSMYAEMERSVTALREDIRDYQQTISSITSSPERFMSPQAMAQQPAFVPENSHLPSFFTNNPWLDVLSKRGSEGTGSIAA
jgi:hypothetical protein